MAPSRAGSATGARTNAGESAPDDDRYLTKDELKEKLIQRQEALDDRLLEVQRSRFVAKAQGREQDVIGALNEEYSDIQTQRLQVLTRLKRLEARQ